MVRVPHLVDQVVEDKDREETPIENFEGGPEAVERELETVKGDHVEETREGEGEESKSFTLLQMVQIQSPVLELSYRTPAAANAPTSSLVITMN